MLVSTLEMKETPNPPKKKKIKRTKCFDADRTMCKILSEAFLRPFFLSPLSLKVFLLVGTKAFISKKMVKHFKNLNSVPGGKI